MRLTTFVLRACLGAALLTGCGGPSRAPAASPADFPLPPQSPTAVGALLDAADRLHLDDAQRQALRDLDAPLAAHFAVVASDLRDLRAPGPAGAGGAGPRAHGGGHRGGGRMGGGMGGGPPGGGGMGGGPPGGGGMGGGPPPGRRPPGPPPGMDPDARRAAREQADAQADELDREQRAAVEQALSLMRPDQLPAARGIIADYFARAAAPPPVLPPIGEGGPPAGASER